MIDLLHTFGKYLKENTELPFVIHPTTATYNEPYLEIVPVGLNYSQVTNDRLYGTTELVGIDIKVSLVATGNEVTFLKYVLNGSLTLNKLFNTGYKTTKKFPFKKWYFTYTYEKKENGRFYSLPDGETGVEYREVWDIQIIVPIEAITNGKNNEEYIIKDITFKKSVESGV